MIKPNMLKKSDILATVSLSWGIAGEDRMSFKYRQAGERLEEKFDIKIISAPNSMRGEKFLRENPKARADDLIWSLENKSVSGILANIGGNDCIDILPFIDINIIKENKKVFIGSSDLFLIHALFFHAGVVSFYGGNLLTSFTESDEVNDYYLNSFKKALFCADDIGEINSPEKYFPGNNQAPLKNDGYQVLNGKGIIKGKLFICTSELKPIQNTKFKLSKQTFQDTILCFEDIIECVTPKDLYDFIIWLYKENILQKIKALIIAKFNEYPQNALYANMVMKALYDLSYTHLPVITGFDFGHTLPKAILPYGVMAEIDLNNLRFVICENAVI